MNAPHRFARLRTCLAPSLLTAATLTLAACGSPATPEDSLAEPTVPSPSASNAGPSSAPSLASPTTTTSTLATTAAAAAETVPASAFEQTPNLTYSLQLNPDSWCYYDRSADHFECALGDAQGLPAPLNPPLPGQEAAGVYHLNFSPTNGFITARSLVGSTPPASKSLEPGQQTTLDQFTVEHLADGAIRVERGSHWYEVSAGGEYTSDTSTP